MSICRTKVDILRTVILHYHLFKNAGTSVDDILKSNFPGRWCSKEFSPRDSSIEVAEWINSNPQNVVFSSHTACGPVPILPNTNVISLLFIREPISRIYSAYKFERQQEADTYGAILAKRVSFGEYVKTRISKVGDRQCSNFQTHRLSSFSSDGETELGQAINSIPFIDVLGVVENFDVSIFKMETVIKRHFPQFKAMRKHLNRTSNDNMIDEGLIRYLNQHNQDDLELYSTVIRQLYSD